MRLWSILLPVLAICALLLSARGGESATPFPAVANVADADALHVLGDADCNETVNAVDALQVLRNTAGLGTVADCIGLGNVNCDSSTNAVDALGILRFTAGLPPIASDDCPAVGSASMRLLTLDKFGDGAVSAFPGGLVCSNNCTAISLAASDGSEVGLDAAPESGSRFDNWSGCDSAVGQSCAVTLDSDKTVFATFAFDEAVIPPTTKVLDDAMMSLLRRVEGDTYYFDPSAAAVAALQPGHVIVSGYGEGLLRKVVAVTTGANEIAVATATATLEDTIERGALVVREDEHASAAGLGDAHVAAAGVSCVILQFKCDVPLDVDLNDAVNVSGSAWFDADPQLAVSFDGWDWACLCFPVREARAVMTFEGHTNLTALVGNEFSAGAKKTIPVMNTTKVFFVGYVPVVVTLDFSIEVGVSGSASGALESTVDLSASYNVGAHYKRGAGWSPVNQWTRSFSHSEPEFLLGAQAKVYVKPVLNMRVYQAAGPSFGVEGYARARVEPLDNPWWTLSAGLGAEAGFKVEAFGLTLADYTLPLWEKEWVLAQADSPPPTVTPAPSPTPEPVSDQQLVSMSLNLDDFGSRYSSFQLNTKSGFKTAEQIAERDCDPSEAAKLVSEGFVKGYDRLYQAPTIYLQLGGKDLVVGTRLFAFGDAAGAAAFFDSSTAAGSSAGQTCNGEVIENIQFFTVPSIGDDAIGVEVTYRQIAPSIRYYGTWVLERRGSVVGAVVVARLTAENSRSEVIADAQLLDAHISSALSSSR